MGGTILHGSWEVLSCQGLGQTAGCLDVCFFLMDLWFWGMCWWSHFRSVEKICIYIIVWDTCKGSLLLCSSCNYMASWILKEDLMTIHEHNYPNIYTILYKIYTVYISIYIYIHSKCVFIWYQQLGCCNVRIRMMPGNLPRRTCLPAFFQRH